MNALDKIQVKTACLATDLADLAAQAPQQAHSILNSAEVAVKRARKRLEALSGEWERIEIKQQHGPSIEFTGRMLCDTQFTTRGAERFDMTLEIWETRGGAYVAVSASTLPGGTGREDERATVVGRQDDPKAMQFAVMEAFKWHSEAKRMVRKALSWDLAIEVE